MELRFECLGEPSRVIARQPWLNCGDRRLDWDDCVRLTANLPGGTTTAGQSRGCAELAGAMRILEQLNPLIPHWSHIALNCSDQGATERFYRQWFGFERARTVSFDGEQIIFLRREGIYIELFESTGHALAERGGDGLQNPGVVRHIAFQTHDLDAFLARIGKAVPISLGPLTFDDFIQGWRSVWLIDPDGVIVEVSQGYRDEDQDHRIGNPAGRA